MSLLRIVLQDENGKQQGESVDLPASALPDAADAGFVCLRFVDPYGDTIFNRLQMQTVLKELQVLMMAGKDREEQSKLQQIQALAEVCREQSHLYLKFVGD